MKKLFAYKLFAVTGLAIFLISFFDIEFPVVNIHDTYIVIDKVLFGTFSLTFYTAFSTIYFLFRKYLNSKIGILQYLFLTIPYLYFIFSEYLASDNYMICYEENLLSKIQCNLPLLLIGMFLIGIILFILNSLIAFVKYIRKVAST
jgi:hypothetical protein